MDSNVNSVKPPYYAVIFTSLLNADNEGYEEMAAFMENLCGTQRGFLGMDHARSGLGITICYWKSREDIKRWKENTEHQIAQKLGNEKWYKEWKVRICMVETEYGKGHD